jgi:hypothetical protein
MQGVNEANNVLLYGCSAMETVGTSNDSLSVSVSAATVKRIDTPPFYFSSRPGAPSSLWLDFAGSVIVNTSKPLVRRMPTPHKGRCA